MRVKRLTGYPIFLKPGHPREAAGETPPNYFSFQLCHFLPRLPILQWRGARCGQDSPVHVGKWRWVQEIESPSPPLR